MDVSYRKINSGFQPVSNNDWKELKEIFPEGFQFFFSVHENPKNMEDERMLYIANEEMENKLAKDCCSIDSKVSLIVGEKGSGKSTLLRNYFNISGNTIKIEKRALVLSVFMNYNCQDKGERFSLDTILAAMNVTLLNRYAVLSDYFSSEKGVKDFYDFIVKMRIDLVYQGSSELLIRKNTEQYLNDARENNPEAYEILKLQFLLMSSLCPICRLIICVDEIDELFEWQQREIVKVFINLYKRMNSFPREKMNKYYAVNLFISMTPECYRTLNKENKMDLFAKSSIILKDDILNMEKYFSRKLKYFSKKYKNNVEPWKKCQRQIGHICQRFGGKYDSMIRNLTFNNINESMLLYAKILCNHRWMKQGDITSSNGWFHSDNYVINNISVIRAIACGENEQFVNDKNAYVSNLLYNTKEKNYSIICLYIISIFVRHSVASSNYGSDFLVLENIERTFDDIFPDNPDIAMEVKKAIQYLYSHKIIMKSYKDITNSKKGIDIDLLTNNSRLYLSSKGAELWKMFQSDSVLIEMCREDYYREYDSPNCCNNPYCAYHLMQTNQQHELFIDLCRIIRELIGLEDKYILIAEENQTKSLLKETFGDKRMCFYLMKGIKSSMEYSGLIRHGEVNGAYLDVEKRLIEL